MIVEDRQALPEWFSYDDEYLFFARNEITEFGPIRFLPADGQLVVRTSLQKHLDFDCVPICYDRQMDEHVAWVFLHGRQKIVRFPGDSDRLEVFQEYESFWAVLDYAVRRMKEAYLDD
ncbi:MAG: hypothetical protein O9322_01655 [Beijerinckiaceae bacterium]|nr:hypothetical protein [Beijerinckiaceae bacterium]MCZ8301969.1 hypothetical protein [Beijerinckiaceae bacterium]